MKHYLSTIILTTTLLAFSSCEKVENKISFIGGDQPVITASTNAVRLEPGEENNIAIKFSWTNPNYQFTTGLSSQDVKYTLEIDEVGKNFSSPKRLNTSFSKDLSVTYTVAELNGILGNTMLLQLDPRRSYNLEARITASIGTNIDQAKRVSANVVTFTARPFPPPPKVEVPAADNLWMTGDAAPSSWTLSPPASQKFTKLSTTKYELTVALPGGGNYKLLQEGAWGSQYHMIAGGTWQGGEFEKKDADPGFPGPPGPGNYKITFDFQLGVYNVVKL